MSFRAKRRISATTIQKRPRVMIAALFFLMAFLMPSASFAAVAGSGAAPAKPTPVCRCRAEFQVKPGFIPKYGNICTNYPEVQAKCGASCNPDTGGSCESDEKLSEAECAKAGSPEKFLSLYSLPAAMYPADMDVSFSCSYIISPGAAGTPAAASGGVILSAVRPQCLQSGNCELDDILLAGTAFANYLTKLGAALFFAAFIYGGGAYLLSFGRKSWAEAGKKAMVGATFGMAIILFAWTLVNYVAGILEGKI